MDLTLDELIEDLQHSRQFFFKHLDGLREDQWDWKPYPECKSIRETLAHLVVDDRSAIESIETGDFPDFDAIAAVAIREAPDNLEKQFALLAESHEQLIALLRTKYANQPLDTEISIWGMNGKVVRLVPHLSSEDYYHAGQVGFIRMAIDPAWNYYKAIYNLG